MADVFYPGTLAADPGTVGRTPLPNAVFQVFELTDTAHVNPLPLKDTSGLTVTSLTSTSQGVLPGVYVTSPNLSHNWVSGTWVWRRDSFDGAQAAVTAAKNASISGASLTAGGDLSFTTLGGTVIAAGNVRGPQGNPGSNTMPADAAVAGFVNDNASATKAALSATFAPRTLRRSHYPAVHCGAFIGIGTTTSYVCRRAFQLPHKAERFRVHVRNFNFLTDTAATGNLSAFQLLIGAHKVTGAGLTGEFVSSPAQLAGGVTLAGGAEWVSGWVAPETYMIDAHEHFLLSYAFTAPAGSQIANGAAAQWAYGVLGGVPAGLVSALLAPGPLASSQSFLDVWIEYETLTAQPTVLVVGNSHTDPGNVGGRAIRGEFTGWPHKVMVMTGAPVANLAISAAGLANYVNDSPKWTYLNPADYTPDIVVLADLPSSDLVSGVAVATVKTQFAEVVDRIHALWPKARILATTNFPRGDQAGGTEALNREWADYLMDCPAGLEQVTDPAPAMRAPEKSRRGLTPSRIALTKGTTATSGGTFAAGTYYWTVTAMNANGETAPAMEVTATLQANGTQALSWSSATGSPELLRYRLYRGTTASSYTTWVQDFLPGTTSYVDSGSSLSGEGGGLAPSWYNTTPDVAKLAPELVAGTDDVHFNERGHSVIAGTIAQMITGKAQ